MAAYAVRLLTISVELGAGAQQAVASETITLSNLRVEATINKANFPGVATAQIRVYGMTLTHVNQLTYAGTSFNTAPRNVITLLAGDTVSGVSAVFKGQIRYAYPDFRDPKEASFFIDAFSIGGLQQPMAPISFKGSVPISQVFSTIANNANLSLENNNVNGVFYNPYFWGTTSQQIVKCTKAADCFSYYSAETNTLAIWPQGGSRTQGQVYQVSVDTGMIVYPAFQQYQIQVRVEFDPTTQYMENGFKINVQSELTSANGVWYIFTLDYLLSSQTPGGPWEMLMTGWSQAYQTQQSNISGGGD